MVTDSNLKPIKDTQTRRLINGSGQVLPRLYCLVHMPAQPIARSLLMPPLLRPPQEAASSSRDPLLP